MNVSTGGLLSAISYYPVHERRRSHGIPSITLAFADTIFKSPLVPYLSTGQAMQRNPKDPVQVEKLRLNPGASQRLALLLAAVSSTLTRVLILALIVLLAGSPVIAETLAGRTIDEALTALQRRGLAIIYSSALVRPDMRVVREPHATAPRAILDEILQPHGLTVQPAPGGQLVVVAAPRPPPVFLHEIVVTPSHTRILNEPLESRQSIHHEQISGTPHLADDLYRAVRQLPGAAGSDVSATFNVRGGDAGEVLVVLDGLELYEPFHLKDFFNVFSTIDSAAVGSVDLITGGFPAEYGDRMSAVMDITTRAPAAPATTSLSIGTLNSRVLSSGMSADARTQWLVTGRGWYPDVILDAAGRPERINTDYYDLLGKVQHLVGTRTTVSLSLLAAFDNLGFQGSRPGEVERVLAEESSQHLWLTVNTDWKEHLSSRSVVASGRIARDRSGENIDAEDGPIEVADGRDFSFVQVKQDWLLELEDRQLFKWGVDVKRLDARYAYARQAVDLHLRPSGQSYAAYVADRFRLAPSLIAELGLRWDQQFWVEDENQLSPRVNVMYTAGPGTVIRAAWGRYYQSQRLNELQVEDGVSEFQRPELAEQWLAGVEHRLTPGLALRIEAYDKELHQVRQRYENLFSPIDLFPEAQDDRVRVAPQGGRARGLELRLKHDRWWISYTLSEAVDKIDGELVPRSWDQRHATAFGVNVPFARGWNANFAGTFHSGWPATGMTAVRRGEEVVLVNGPRNRERFPPYLRFDIRASRTIATRRGDVAITAEVLNLTNRANVCCVADFEPLVGPDGRIEVARDERYWAPIIPSLSVAWRF